MFALLFILGAALCNGYETEPLDYGGKIKIRLPIRTDKLMFFREGESNGTILWSRYNTPTDSRGYKIGSHYIIEKSTQRDSGRYESMDKNGGHMSERTFSVITNSKTTHLTAEEDFRYKFDLEEDSCNIKFKPSSYVASIDIVNRGREQFRSYSICPSLETYAPCEIVFDNIVESCQGDFEVYDNYDNLAWHLELVISPAPESFDLKSIIFSTVIPTVLVICSCILKHCCCKTSSKKDKPSENEPVLLNRTDFTEQSEMLYPAQPNASTGPLIHNPPVNVPPSYSEVSAPAGPTHAPTVPVSYDPTVPPSSSPTVPVSFAPTVPPSSSPTVPVSFAPTAPPSFAPTVSFAPTLPSSSELDPRFELKSFTLSSYSPLSSDTTEGGVYHSDKLNF